jgi:pimeloyl-ACP methyl ester carboxylesterase
MVPLMQRLRCTPTAPGSNQVVNASCEALHPGPEQDNAVPPVIVLLHGQPDISVSFWPLRAALHARLGHSVQVIVPDRPGYGANLRASTDFAGNAEWLEGILRRTGAGPVVIVGHSWAGGVGILTASRSRTPIAGLVALASIGPDCLLPIDPWLARPIIGEVLSFASLRIGRPILLHGPLGILRQHLSETERRYGRASAMAMLARPVWRSFLAEQRTLVQQLPDINRALREVAVPALVLHGSADALIPAVTPVALAQLLPNARRIELAGAGHDLHLRRTAEIAEHIAAFVRPLLGPI